MIYVTFSFADKTLGPGTPHVSFSRSALRQKKHDGCGFIYGFTQSAKNLDDSFSLSRLTLRGLTKEGLENATSATFFFLPLSSVLERLKSPTFSRDELSCFVYNPKYNKVTTNWFCNLHNIAKRRTIKNDKHTSNI